MTRLTPLDQLQSALAGRYAVEREIGAGGMATVYLARDLKHNRRVALKVLKPELGAVLGVERFLSEIQVTANLQHPNLLPLFDSGEANGLLFYVMPFVEGETLRARLDREKQLPVDEAVRLAVAIAGALEYAHSNGVIHRDMKPENILLQAGQPVIADFGIALAVSNAGGARVTQTGLSLGTPQYMSPEQATGDKVIDARSDIYSLAAMTYEMLTGEPPHAGTSAQAIIAKLLTEEVRPLTVLRRAVPEHVDAAVRHGLEKLAADRFASAAEFAAALSGVRPFTMAGTTAMRSAHGVRGMASLSTGMRALFAVFAVAAIGGVSAATWLATRPVPRVTPVVFDIGLPDSVTLYAGGGSKLALSRDGTKLVFVGVRSGRIALYLRRLSDPVAQEIRGSELDANNGNVSPAISPDGEWVAFQSSESDRIVLKRLPIAGGTAQILADSGNTVRWGTPDMIVYGLGGSIWTGTPGGRTGRRVAIADSSSGIFSLQMPDPLPGNTHVLVSLVTTRVGPPADSMRLGVVSLTDGTVTDLGVRGTFPHYVSTGHIVFSRPPGLVLVAPFSLRARKITGPETVLLENIWTGSGGAGGFAVSENGTVAFHAGEYDGVRRSLVAVDRRGAERPIPGDENEYQRPRVSPDGARILASVTRRDVGPRRTGLALIDGETGATQSLASAGSGYLGDWNRDGATAVFVRSTGQGYDIVGRPWDGRAGDTVLARDLKTEVLDLSLGPSRGYSALGIRRGAYSEDLFIAPTDSLGAMRPFAVGGNHAMPTVSPDGRLLAWVMRESGRAAQVLVAALPGPGPRVQVSVSGGSGPIWNESGTRLYFRGPDRIMVADIAQATLRVTARDSLFEDRFFPDTPRDANWDLIPGRNEFLMLKLAAPRQSVPRVLLNWPQLLAAPAGTTPPER